MKKYEKNTSWVMSQYTFFPLDSLDYDTRQFVEPKVKLACFTLKDVKKDPNLNKKERKTTRTLLLVAVASS